jgi:hypothetical protein
LVSTLGGGIASQLLNLEDVAAEAGFEPYRSRHDGRIFPRINGILFITMWRFTKNNCITESFHRKMKRIQRRAYDFKNLNSYGLRDIAQYG